MHLAEQKAQARTAISERLARLSENDRAAESRSVCRRIIEKLPADPIAVCVYAALKSEIDLSLLIQTLRERNFPLYFPRHEGNKMVFRRVDDSSALMKGAYGILEPPESALLLDPAALGIAIIPARAYAKDGRRLGRGNGGYDIWIRSQRSLNPKTQFWGVCFECQILADIPMEAHDEKVDAVVTARG